MSVSIFDTTKCQLGEGPLWHPLLKQFFWFDINAMQLLTKTASGQRKVWQFDEHVSAAGWVDADTLLIVSETAFFKFTISTGAQEILAPLEADNPITRSNDGRADPFGGMWIGTMGKQAEKHAGAIYRYYRGEVRTLYPNITISNSICFAPDGRTAYFTDTPTKQIMRQTLDAQGWPIGDTEIFIDLNQAGFAPDGSVVDAEGCLWNAQWGASRVARYDANGLFLSAIDMPDAKQTTCPAFGGDDLTTLFCTSAADGDDSANAGRTFSVKTDVKGQPEHQVIL
ncbi:MAG: SMP-30/gluconolactonase/LRE family protein [Rhizobiales bacterium]|nr:SMP-30/gluconolactonase/LRE family protein [Hyphomicrobiales bacterium]NRB14551.1 SMP-30/gluconolactonase/LRE family protein [Hyphomicrobiales bacterium]